MYNVENLKILQIIDSTEPGGAEMMAIRIANALASVGTKNFLLVTRYFGGCEVHLNNSTIVKNLNRNKKLTFIDCFLAYKFAKNNEIKIIHAHTGSIYIGFLLKILLKDVKLIWHDHYGDAEFLEKRKVRFEFLYKYFLSGVVVVNSKLEDYSKNKLKISNVKLIYNFSEYINKIPKKNPINSKCEILMIANFRRQKNHHLAIEVMKLISSYKTFVNYKLTLVGQIIDELYYKEIIDSLIGYKLNIDLIHNSNNASEYIQNADICILTSDSEGMPLAIIEYASFAKPIVCTRVGEIPIIFKDRKDVILCDPGNNIEFTENIIELNANREYANKIGSNARSKMIDNFTDRAFLDSYFNFLSSI